MTKRKERLTVTVDAELLRAGESAVKEGRAESLSAWVNRALVERVSREKRLIALGNAIDAYEAEFGSISDQEVRDQMRADRTAARIVRGERAAPRRQAGGDR